MPDLTAAFLLTAASAAVFLIAFHMGIKTLKNWPYFRTAVAYMTLVAFANFVFRMWTLYHRWTDRPLPSSAVTLALVLQLSLACALFLGVSLGYFRAQAVKNGSN